MVLCYLVENVIDEFKESYTSELLFYNRPKNN